MLTRRAVGNAGAVFLGLVIAALLLARVAAFQERADPLDEVLAEVGGQLELKSHVAFGNVFIVEIQSVLEQRTEKWGAEDVDNQVIVYRALVERTLRGNAAGEIEIQYAGADVLSPDTMGFGPLEVGKRYMLSAGIPTDAGAYPVYAGMGTILIEDEKAEEALVAEVERLIPIVAQEQRDAILEVTAEAVKERSGD